MQPDLEVIRIGEGESFRVWSHGYPYSTVRWHFHPEYELHHVVATSGRYFVGDFIGAFEPDNLVLVGPNLPHNWVSDVSDEDVIPIRNRVLQFTNETLQGMMEAIPELGGLSDLLERSRSGVLFSKKAAAVVGPLFRELQESVGLRRIELFLGIFDVLSTDTDARLLTSQEYHPDPKAYMSSRLNSVLAYINDNLTEAFNEDDLAEIAGLSRSAFSRTFSQHTGLTFVKYVNRLRINLACSILLSDEGMKIADVCFASGFNNLSNFNRQFVESKGMSPSKFRAAMLSQITGEEDRCCRVA
ncbi:AraC family transcriptional regulator [Ruegeria arenilitoris]|uniref:AraC family transcriptional regulator n=1 Tax=Ruegeria arenilitoris TaxID=1173585 RepID=UPI001480C2F0|nr:AraC family transcriptional regulator [Ruegeria arenilitoris]